MKIAHLAVPKSGSNILRNEMGWQGKQRIYPRSEEEQRVQLGGMIARGDVMGHLYYTEKVAEMLDDYFIIFQYRDPRDVIVSGKSFAEKLNIRDDWEFVIRKYSESMVKMEPWFEHCNLAISYEELIKKSYPKTHTFHKGKAGCWKTEFPEDLWDLYNELCAPVKYWEVDR